ncbi:MAG TPA: hypothetical protein PKD92_13580, partial [Novosphingobium sp.]|nr:hypothetical protein [Novosphingobium sp.]
MFDKPLQHDPALRPILRHAFVQQGRIGNRQHGALAHRAARCAVGKGAVPAIADAALLDEGVP